MLNSSICLSASLYKKKKMVGWNKDVSSGVFGGIWGGSKCVFKQSCGVFSKIILLKGMFKKKKSHSIYIIINYI